MPAYLKNDFLSPPFVAACKHDHEWPVQTFKLTEIHGESAQGDASQMKPTRFLPHSLKPQADCPVCGAPAISLKRAEHTEDISISD